MGQKQTAPPFFRQIREAFGLVTACHSDFSVEPGAEPDPTYHHRRNESEGFQLDYGFVPES